MNLNDAADFCLKSVTVFETFERIVSLCHDSLPTLTRLHSELKSEVQGMWQELVALIPSVITFLEACIQLADFGINRGNYRGPSLASQTFTRRDNVSAFPSANSWFQTAFEVAAWPFRMLSNLLGSAATTPDTNLETDSVGQQTFEDDFTKLFNKCIGYWKPLSKRVEDFPKKLEPLVDECVSQVQRATNLETLWSCRCMCCGGLGMLATVSTAVIVETVLDPEKLPAAIVEMVEPGMKYAWWAVLALIMVVCLSVYAAYSTWMCRRECRQIIDSLESVRNELENMKSLLKKKILTYGESYTSTATQARDKLEKPSKLNDSELTKLMKQICKSAKQLKYELQKLLSENTDLCLD